MESASGDFTCTYFMQHVLSQLKPQFSWHFIAIHCKEGKGRERDNFKQGDADATGLVKGFNTKDLEETYTCSV